MASSETLRIAALEFLAATEACDGTDDGSHEELAMFDVYAKFTEAVGFGFEASPEEVARLVIDLTATISIEADKFHWRWRCSCGSKGVRYAFREDVERNGRDHIKKRHGIVRKTEDDCRSAEPSAPAELANRIQCAIEDEARVWGEESFYRPSGSQIWSHVAYRITQVVMREVVHHE